MESLKIDISKVFGFVPKTDIYSLSEKTVEYARALEKKTGKGNDYSGMG